MNNINQNITEMTDTELTEEQLTRLFTPGMPELAKFRSIVQQFIEEHPKLRFYNLIWPFAEAYRIVHFEEQCDCDSVPNDPVESNDTFIICNECGRRWDQRYDDDEIINDECCIKWQHQKIKEQKALIIATAKKYILPDIVESILAHYL